MKVLARLLSQIDTWQCSNLMKCTLIWIRELKEINRLLSQIDILHQKYLKIKPRPETPTMKVLARLFSQIYTWQCSNLVKCTLIWIRELKEINRLFSQMDILHEKLIKFWSRKPSICDNVLQSGSPTPPGVEFWSPKIRFDPPGHRKTTAIDT